MIEISSCVRFCGITLWKFFINWELSNDKTILNAGMLIRTVEVFDKKSKMDFGNCLLYGYYWDKDLKEESEDIFLDWVSRQAEKISSLLLYLSYF